MNIFFRELKSHRKGLFFWSLGMFLLIASGMMKYASLLGGGQSVSQLMDSFPKSIQTIFGLSGFDISKPREYFGVLFLYIALMATIHAILLGTDLISKEERDKTTEYLFVKPISRQSVISYKIFAGLVNLIVFNLVTLLSSILFVNQFGGGTSITPDILLLMVGLFMLQLVFFSIGIAIAAACKKPRYSTGIATSLLLITLILYFIINFNSKLDYLSYLTPYKYFDARTILNTGSLDSLYILISVVLIILLTWSAYFTFKKRDLYI